MSFDVGKFLNQSHELRNNRKFRQAYEFCKLKLKECRDMGSPDKFILFELGIICYYLGLKEEGLDCLNNLMIDPNISEADLHMYNGSTINIKYYIEPIKSIITHEIKFPIQKNYFLSSSSMISLGDNRYLSNFRCINWTIHHENGSYLTQPIENSKYRFNTTNYSVLIEGTSIKWIKQLKNICLDPIIEKRIGHLGEFCGLEDLRLFDYDEKGYHFFCSSTEFHILGIQKIAYGIFNDNGEIHTLKVLHIGNLDSVQKNWLPFKLNNQKYFIYGYNPFQIYTFDDNELKLVVNHKFTNYMGFIKGSAPPIPYSFKGKNGLLFTVHQNDINVYPRSYFHRFMWMSEDFNEFYISTLFYFEKFPIEFNLSIFNTGSSIGITYTCMDINPKIKFIEYEEIDRMLAWKQLSIQS